MASRRGRGGPHAPFIARDDAHLCPCLRADARDAGAAGGRLVLGLRQRRAAAGDGDDAPPKRPSYREGFFFALLNVGAIAVLGLVTTVVTARIYGIEVVGQFALVYAPVGAVWFLSTVREQPALIRVLAPLHGRDPLVTGLWAATFAFSFALTLVISVLGMVAT